MKVSRRNRTKLHNVAYYSVTDKAQRDGSQQKRREPGKRKVRTPVSFKIPPELIL